MAVWQYPLNLEVINAMGQNSLSGYLDIKFIEVGDDYLSATMPVSEKVKQPLGLLHGGASVVLAETLGSIASIMCIDTLIYSAVGVEINSNHLKAVLAGTVTGTVRPLRIGKRIHVWEIDIVNGEGQLINRSRLTTMIVNR